MDTPVPDKAWIYRGLSQGKSIEGTVFAKTADEAKIKLARLRIENVTLQGGNTPKQATTVSTSTMPLVPVPSVPMAANPPKFPEMPKPFSAPPAHTCMHSPGQENRKQEIPKSKQTLIICNIAEASKKVDPLLVAGGKVVKFAMHPDLHGILMLAMVIEQEQS